MTPVRIIPLAAALVASALFGGSAVSLGAATPERTVTEGSLAGTPDYGSYAWPVQGPVIRAFEAPADPYSAGHRGIDIATAFGSPMGAAQDGVVTFAGWVGGFLFISIDHPDGVRTTYSWLSAISVHKGDPVRRGQIIGGTGHGHPDVATPHLHFGARIGSTYIDPMLLLAGGSVVGLVHLAPLGGTASRGEQASVGLPEVLAQLPLRPPRPGQTDLLRSPPTMAPSWNRSPAARTY